MGQLACLWLHNKFKTESGFEFEKFVQGSDLLDIFDPLLGLGSLVILFYMVKTLDCTIF